jgi:hypothetical protein
VGLPTRSVGPTDRSAFFLVGRTHLSGTAVSLVGGTQGCPCLTHGNTEVTDTDTKQSHLEETEKGYIVTDFVMGHEKPTLFTTKLAMGLKSPLPLGPLNRGPEPSCQTL